MASSPDRPADTGDQDSADDAKAAVGNGHGQQHDHSFEHLPEPGGKSVQVANIATIVCAVFTVIGVVISAIALVSR